MKYLKRKRETRKFRAGNIKNNDMHEYKKRPTHTTAAILYVIIFELDHDIPSYVPPYPSAALVQSVPAP